MFPDVCPTSHLPLQPLVTILQVVLGFFRFWKPSENKGFDAGGATSAGPLITAPAPGSGDGSGASSRRQLPVSPRNTGGPFVFLSTFKWEMRKGWDILLHAYLKVGVRYGTKRGPLI